jgi:hypothetical protein
VALALPVYSFAALSAAYAAVAVQTFFVIQTLLRHYIAQLSATYAAVVLLFYSQRYRYGTGTGTGTVEREG